MTDVPDARLLEQFARNGSEEAFAALVQRHIALVHSVALRHTANAQHAQDITQAVFVILARKAGTLGRRTVLPGWLYHTARLTAANLQRAETSRVRREQEAFMQSQLEEPVNDALWRELSPQLDEAMAGLGTSERDALVLRYFQNKSMAEVGKFLGLEENTAQKRVSRALEKLRAFFTKRGVSSTTAIIAGMISANSVQAVPVALAKSVTAVALTKGAAASVSTLTLIKAALKIMAWQKIKMAMLIGAVTILAAGTTTLAVQHESQPSASISYKMADGVLQWAEGVDKTKLNIHATVVSKNKAVSPTNIVFTIQSAVKGPIPVGLATNGEVIDFPHDEALRRENPKITSNQPEDSLEFTIWGDWPIPDDLIFRYNWLGDEVVETSKAIANVSSTIMKPNDVGWLNYVEWLFSPRLKVQGVMFAFPKSSVGKATVEIEAASGTKTYRADANGQIKLKLDKALLLENPEVKVSEKPLGVGPDLQF